MEPAEAAQVLIHAWNIDDDAERRAELDLCCEPGARFVGPYGDTASLEAFNASVGAFRRAFPRAVVVMGSPDSHHGFARLRWETRWNDGREPLFGDDFVVFGQDGRISLVVSFDGGPGVPAE